MEVQASRFDERTLLKADYATPADFVMHSARSKAAEVMTRLQRDIKPPDVVVGMHLHRSSRLLGRRLFCRMGLSRLTLVDLSLAGAFGHRG